MDFLEAKCHNSIKIALRFIVTSSFGNKSAYAEVMSQRDITIYFDYAYISYSDMMYE